MFDNPALSPAQQEIWDACQEWGWHNGFVVPVHGPGGYFSYISIASPERELDLSFANRAEIQLYALLAHERCYELERHRGRAHGPQKALQRAGRRECLRWVAAGKTDWEIGMILAIAATTVKFHVNSARRKLGAATRPQATAIMALRGML